MILLRVMANPRWSPYWLSAAILLLYAAAPAAIGHLFEADKAFFQLSGLAICAVGGITLGFSVSWLDRAFAPNTARLIVPARWFHVAIWGSFAIFVLVSVATAESVPLISALRGATEADLSAERGAFFKLRGGWQIALGYISAIYAGVLLPYSMSLLFLARRPTAFPSAIAFLLYSMLSLQKAMFVQVLAPLFALVAGGRLWRAWAIVPLVAVSFGVLTANTILARGTQSVEEAVVAQRLEELETGSPDATPDERAAAREVMMKDREEQASLPFPLRDNYFTARYLPVSTLDQLTWRSLAVPIFTASDAIKVFEQKFESRPLLGATSSLIASVLRLPRVNYDAEVFAYQWGISDIGRSNAVYFIEGYVNFGVLGVVLFSVFVGQALRWFWKSKDDAFVAMWPLFCWNVFSAGLLGALLSNGYVLLFLVAFFVRVRPEAEIRAGC